MRPNHGQLGPKLAMSIACGALFTPRVAHSESLRVWMEVVRAPESQSCPDAATVLATQTQLFPGLAVIPVRDAGQASLLAAVSVRRSTEGHDALLTVWGSQHGQRRIVDRDDECRGLAHALAVALTLLVEPDAKPTAQPMPAGPVAPTPSPDRRPGRLLGAATAEGGVLAGGGILGSTLAFGGFLGVGLWHRVGLGLRGRAVRLGNVAKHELGGQVGVDLWAAMFGPCWQLAPTKRWAVSPCFYVGWGEQRGVASAYSSGHSEAKVLWRVLGPSLEVTLALLGPLEGMVSGGMTVRLHHEKFLIMEGSRPVVVQEQEPAGAYLALGLGLRWPISTGPHGR